MVISIESSAPCKVIFSGEHAVINGAAAVAMAIDYRTKTTINLSPVDLNSVSLVVTINETRFSVAKWALFDLSTFTPEIDRNLQKLDFSGPFLDQIRHFVESPPGQNPDLTTVATIFVCLLFALGLQQTPVEVVVEIQTPFTGGLGSSASVGCSLSAAFLALRALKSGDSAFLWDKGKAVAANRLAFECERIAHGTPSGLDNTIVTFGGLVKYKNQKVISHVTENPFPPNLKMVIVDSGVKRKTKSLVQKVSSAATRHAEIHRKIFSVIDSVSEEIFEICQKSKSPDEGQNSLISDVWFDDLKSLFFVSQCMLKALKTSVPEVDEIVKICEGCGCAAKLTGAGGGGAVLGLVFEKQEGDADALILKLKERGFSAYPAAADFEGTVAKVNYI